jgi:DNA-binding beta-propeller fold protein YncE
VPKLLVALCLLSCVVATGAASRTTDTPPQGALTDIGGVGGCVAEADHPVGLEQHDAARDGCLSLQGMMELHHVALSLDGRFVYTVAGVNVFPEEQSTLRIFRRDPGSGAVAPVRGRTGCVERWGPTIDIGCGLARNLQLVRFVTVSPDDRFVYVTSAGGMAVFKRDRKTGGLTQLQGRDGCLSAWEPGCERIPGASIPGSTSLLEDVAFSSDGRFAYSANSSGYVLMFSRDLKSGALRPLSAGPSCFQEVAAGVPTQGCVRARAIDAARSVTLSPDGRFAYVADIDDALAIFSRNAKTGRLTQLSGTSGCVSEGGRDGCASGAGIYGSHRLSLTSDGRFGYLAGKRGSNRGSSLVEFRRNVTTGALTEFGCFDEDGSDGCTVGRDLRGAHAAILSADGRNVYVTSDQEEGGIAIFARDATTGALTQLSGAYGCLSPVPWENCGVSRRMGGIHYLVFSPDGKFAYAAGESSAALIVLRRS